MVHESKIFTLWPYKKKICSVNFLPALTSSDTDSHPTKGLIVVFGIQVLGVDEMA